MARPRSNKPREFSRNLRVGEEVRHALSALLQRGEVSEFQSTIPITVSEVKVSPDLRHAVAFIYPLGGRDKDAILKALREATPAFRQHLAGAVQLQFVPNLRFELDTSFDEADKINKILQEDKNRQNKTGLSS
jgi:ribosome-binding factor A